MSQKARVGAVEINLSRFGISANGLLARQRSALYNVPQATATSFGLGGIFAGCFPDSSQGAALLDTARTVP